MPPPPEDSRSRSALVAAVLFAGTLLLFCRATGFAFLDLDDPDYVTANAHVQGGLTWAGVRWACTSGDAANWHPLTWLSHQLDWQLFGADPRGHHATSVLLHAVNAVLAFLALRRLTGAFWTSAVAAALFAWHPLRVESVAWVAERKDVLSALFGLLTLWAYAVYAGRRRAGAPAGRWYAAALGAFALGLLCKPMLVTLPFVLLLLDVWPLRRPATESWRRLVAEKAPFLLLTASSCVITFLVQRAGDAVVVTLPAGVRLANAAVAGARYLGKFLWPFDLAVGYPYPARWPVAVVGGAVLLLAGLAALAWGQRRQRPWLLTGGLWFGGMLVPVIGLVQVGLQAMADRYTYLPALGLELALLWTVREITRPRWLRPAAAGLVLAGCAARTWDQLAVWRGPATLYAHAVAVDDRNFLAHSYLGTLLLNEHQPAAAETHLRRAVELNSDYIAGRHRLGVALLQLGRTREARDVWTALLERRPRFAAAHYELGVLLLHEGHPEEALAHFQAALRTKPGVDKVHVALGLAEMRLGRTDAALHDYEMALELNPLNPEAHSSLADALLAIHRDEEALPHYEAAARLRPDGVEEWNRLGDVLRSVGRLEPAAGAYRQVLELQADNVTAHFGLGAALEDLGQTEEAYAHYAAAADADPAFADAQYNLGVLLLNRGDAGEALPRFGAALRSRPDHPQARLGLALAALQLGRFQEAVTAGEQALVLNPDNAAAHRCLGAALRATGRLDEAIAHFESAVRLQPEDGDARAELQAARQARAGPPGPPPAP